eukprot:352223-Rhodomonas_salina.1
MCGSGSRPSGSSVPTIHPVSRIITGLAVTGLRNTMANNALACKHTMCAERVRCVGTDRVDAVHLELLRAQRRQGPRVLPHVLKSAPPA